MTTVILLHATYYTVMVLHCLRIVHGVLLVHTTHFCLLCDSCCLLRGPSRPTAPKLLVVMPSFSWLTRLRSARMVNTEVVPAGACWLVTDSLSLYTALALACCTPLSRSVAACWDAGQDLLTWSFLLLPHLVLLTRSGLVRQ